MAVLRGVRYGGHFELSPPIPPGRSSRGPTAPRSGRRKRVGTSLRFRPRSLSLTLALVLLPAGCQQEPERHVDPRLVEALGLQGDELVHTISLGGRGSEEHIVPPSLEISVGEVVQFVTVDRRVHTIRFPADSLAPPEAAFIETTGQGASPPLLGLGSRFVLTSENAPPGRYPFLSSGHGEATGGIIFVR